MFDNLNVMNPLKNHFFFCDFFQNFHYKKGLSKDRSPKTFFAFWQKFSQNKKADFKQCFFFPFLF